MPPHRKNRPSRRPWPTKTDRMVSRPQGAMPTVAEVEKAIGLKVAHWPGRCHEISCKMLDARLVAGEEQYGHYYGPVSASYARRGLPFQKHGWIRAPDGRVIDPTRWVFEGVAPYIYHGPADDYDAAKQRLRAGALGPYPATGASSADASPGLTDAQRAARARPIQLAVTGTARDRLAGLTGGQVADFSFDQAYWLAHVPLAMLGDDAAAIYTALIEAGHGALIPFDARRVALGRPMASHRPDDRRG